MHLSEGRLLEHLDGALGAEGSADVEAHLASCAACRGALVALRVRSASLGRLLETIDVEPPAERVRNAVAEARRRHASRRPRPSGGGGSWWSRRSRLAQAALLLLLLGVVGGLSAALPGSPVRSWLTSVGEAPVEPTAGSPERTAVLGEPLSGSLTVAVDGLRDGDVVEVEWIDGASPRVSAPSGSRYRVVPGTVEAEVGRPPGGPSGGAAPARVTVELPRRLTSVVVETDRGVLLTKQAGSIEPVATVSDSTRSTLRFEIGGG